jgi:hypothetical protein
MVLLNSSKRARYASTIIVQNQGGGNKKAGLPYQVGRDSWVNIYMGTSSNVKKENRSCCSAKNMAMTYTNASQSRPIGRTGNPSYWNFV